MKRKPVILWLADNPSWAYASIVKQIGETLKNYTHTVIFMVSGKIDLTALSQQIADADVVIPMYINYLGSFPDRSKVALFLSGMRPFE